MSTEAIWSKVVMPEFYWLLVLCLLFGSTCARAAPYPDEPQNNLPAELNEILREPMLSSILAWADQDELADYAWRRHAHCEGHTPRDCLYNYYFNRYQNRKLDLSEPGAFHLVVVTTWLCVYALGFEAARITGFAITPLFLLGAITLYGISNLLIIGLIEYNQKPLQKHFNDPVKNKFLTDAQNDYLQLILALLASSTARTGATVETSVKKRKPVIMKKTDDRRPINLQTLSLFSDLNFLGNTRQVVMLNRKMEAMGFFRIFVRAPKRNEMQLVLESMDRHYILTARPFNLTALVSLLEKADVGSVRLVHVQQKKHFH